jgi:hypothetical protein
MSVLAKRNYDQIHKIHEEGGARENKTKISRVMACMLQDGKIKRSDLTKVQEEGIKRHLDHQLLTPKGIREKDRSKLYEEYLNTGQISFMSMLKAQCAPADEEYEKKIDGLRERKVGKIISSSEDVKALLVQSDYSDCKRGGEIVKFITENYDTTVEVLDEMKGYAIPYIVRDIIVWYIEDHKTRCKARCEPTPEYWMGIICEAFQKLPFAFEDSEDSFEPNKEDFDDEIKRDIKRRMQLRERKKQDIANLNEKYGINLTYADAEEEEDEIRAEGEDKIRLSAWSVEWRYDLPSGYGVFALGMSMGFCNAISDVLPGSVVVACGSTAYRDGSDNVLVCGYSDDIF